VTRPILERGGYRHVVTISPHVDTDFFRPGTARPDRPFTVGYVGRLHAQKGVDLLLEALASLPGEVRLVIVGNGPEEERLRRLSRDAGMDNRVAWRGAMSHRELPGQYRDMDALVLPSRTGPRWKEQFGRVLIEAMSSGVPVIGSNSGGIPDVIGQAGQLFQEGDVRSLASCISRLATDAAFRASQAVAGRDRAVTFFSVPVAVAAYASFLKGIHAERSHPD
jgi:glycosyltransferase involved in cell wall biosynthesis